MLGEIIWRAKAADKIGGFNMVLYNHDSDDEYTIMCYPEAKWSCKSDFGPKRGETFCLPLNVGKNGMKIFPSLMLGGINLFDCWRYFHEPIKHGFAMGYNYNGRLRAEHLRMHVQL